MKAKARFEPVMFKPPSTAGTFDMDVVYGESTDRHGHSDNIRLRLPQGTIGALNSLVEQCDHFRTYADLIRTAVVLYEKALYEKLKDDVGFDDNIVFLSIVAAEGERQDYLNDLEDDIITGLEERMKTGFELRKAEMVTGVYNHAMELLKQGPSAPAYVDRLEGVVKEATRWLKIDEEL